VARRRGNREGSIYQRASDGRWIGAVSAGDGSAGRSGRKMVSAPTRQEALRKLRELQRQLDDGLPPPDASMTVAQLLDRWHAHVIRHQVARTASDNYKRVADHHIVPALGRKKLKELTPGDIDRLMAQKLEAGLSVSTVRRIRSVLSQALTQGIRWGSVNRNVASLTRGPRQPRQEGRTLTPSQARTLLASLRGHRNEAVYSLMLSTGLRRGEALGLRWDDLDLDEEILIVRRQLKRGGGLSDRRRHQDDEEPSSGAPTVTDDRGPSSAPGRAGSPAAQDGPGLAGHGLRLHHGEGNALRSEEPLPGLPACVSTGRLGRLAPP
jgi:integrase